MQLHLKCLVTGALALKVSGGGPHLKPHLKPSAHLASLGVVISPLYRVFSDLAVKSPLRLRRASPAVLPSLCPAWHTPACHRSHSPPLPATLCHPMPPYATLCHPCSHPPPFLFVDRRRLVLRSSRATSPTRLTQQHQLRSRRAFFAFVCAGIASTGATVHQRGFFARENATHRAAVSSL